MAGEDERCLIVTGANGSGKTSVLEAISLLAPGRGLRGAQLYELAHSETDEDGWSITARLVAPCGPVDIRIEMKRDNRTAKPAKTIEIDGRVTRCQAALAEILGVVWVTPETERLFADGPAARRRFLDRLMVAVYPGHAQRLADYEKALLERSTLLRRRMFDPTWLDALENTMATTGVAIVAARVDFAARLTALAEKMIPRLPRAIAEVGGVVEGWLAEEPALAVEEHLAEALARSRGEDSETGGAAMGPHKSDLCIRDARTGRPGRRCSTGEQKVLLISTVLAAVHLQTAERRMTPVLLLDEVAAHLDKENRSALFEAAGHTGAQVWYTGTDLSVFDPLSKQASIIALGGD